MEPAQPTPIRETSYQVAEGQDFSTNRHWVPYVPLPENTKLGERPSINLTLKKRGPDFFKGSVYINWPGSLTSESLKVLVENAEFPVVFDYYSFDGKEVNPEGPDPKKGVLENLNAQMDAHEAEYDEAAYVGLYARSKVDSRENPFLYAFKGSADIDSSNEMELSFELEAWADQRFRKLFMALMEKSYIDQKQTIAWNEVEAAITKAISKVTELPEERIGTRYAPWNEVRQKHRNNLGLTPTG